jgi:hypothetical protein
MIAVAQNTNNTNMSYSLSKFREILFNGFNFVIPNDNVDLINLLASQVGSQTYVKTPVFKKRDPSDGAIFGASHHSNFKLGGGNRKKKGNRNMEINDDDWESLRTFQATKIEQKNAMDSQIDLIRLLLNKLTDKTFSEIRGNIIAKLDEITSSSDFTEDVATKISNVIYDISANNKFFSKIYADLYADIVNKYEFTRDTFTKKYDCFKNEFTTIQFVDPNVNYDLWCDINAQNEKRKANSQFFVNLAIIGFLPKVSIVKILVMLLDTIVTMVNQTDKKNEVDEITENIVILYNNTIIDAVLHAESGESDDDDSQDFEINGCSIVETVTKLANSKTKDYKSLTNKTIFKFMDLIEM